MIRDRAQLAAKEEAVEGTAIALAGADALLVANPVFKADHEVVDRDLVAASLSPFAAVAGKRSATIEFDVEVKGSGTAGTAPALGKLLKACGFGETVVASTSVTYLPASSSIVSLTMALYLDGTIKQIWGARGDVSLKLENGKPAWFHFVFTGADFSVADGALLSAGVSYESTAPQPFLSASFTVDSYAALVSMLDIKMGNQVALRPDANTASGHKSAVITRRRPTLSMDPEFVLVATYDFYDKLRDNNEGALTATLGATAGNICTVTAPKVQYTGIAHADVEGWATLGVDCRLNRSSGDDELSIAFT